MIPITSGAGVESPFYKNKQAAIEALAFFRPNFSSFDFAINKFLEQGGSQLSEFLDRLTDFTKFFFKNAGESSPKFKEKRDLERAFELREYVIKRMIEIGSNIFPEPEEVNKTNMGNFYNKEIICAAAVEMKEQIESIVDLQSFWLYGSALQNKRLPGDLDFKAVTKDPINFEQYSKLMKIRMKVVLDGQEIPAEFSLIDRPTLRAIYPLDDILWLGNTAWNFGDNNKVFAHPNLGKLQNKSMLIQEMIKLYRMSKELEDSNQRIQSIEYYTRNPKILKVRIRNLNIMAESLRNLGSSQIPPNYNFCPEGSVEAKFDAVKNEFYRLTEMINEDLVGC